jgi:hypothetical protein
VKLTVDGEPDGLLLLRGGVDLHVRQRVLRGLRHGEGRRRRAVCLRRRAGLDAVARKRRLGLCETWAGFDGVLGFI